MSNKSNRKKINSNTPIHWPTVILISGLVVLLIPAITIGLVFLDAFEGTGSALVGNRFTNEMQEEISKDQIKQIETELEAINAMNKVNVNLLSATLRITVLTSNEISEEEIVALSETLLDKVFAIVPKEVYFTLNSSYKQYDFEMHVFNDRMVVEEENYLYVLSTLNSTMAEPIIQLVSNPVDPEFVAELYQSILDKIEQEENPDEGQDEESEGDNEETAGDNEDG